MIRIDVVAKAVGVKVQDARETCFVRRSRPIVAVVADIVETAIIAAAITRNRIPDSPC